MSFTRMPTTTVFFLAVLALALAATPGLAQTPPPSGDGGVGGPHGTVHSLRPSETNRHVITFRAEEPAAVYVEREGTGPLLLTVLRPDGSLIGRATIEAEQRMGYVRWVPTRTEPVRIEVANRSDRFEMYLLISN